MKLPKSYLTMKRFTIEQANKVYDVLEEFTGANPDWRDDFVYNHTEADYMCNEWRFCGNLGFGGKYWSQTNDVTCYPEDMDIERETIIKLTNKNLKKVLDID